LPIKAWAHLSPAHGSPEKEHSGLALQLQIAFNPSCKYSDES